MKELSGAGESMWMVRMKAPEKTSFQMLSPAAESFFTYFYNALRALNPIF